VEGEEDGVAEGGGKGERIEKSTGVMNVVVGWTRGEGTCMRTPGVIDTLGRGGVEAKGLVWSNRTEWAECVETERRNFGAAGKGILLPCHRYPRK